MQRLPHNNTADRHAYASKSKTRAMATMLAMLPVTITVLVMKVFVILLTMMMTILILMLRTVGLPVFDRASDALQRNLCRQLCCCLLRKSPARSLSSWQESPQSIVKAQYVFLELKTDAQPETLTAAVLAI